MRRRFELVRIVSQRCVLASFVAVGCSGDDSAGGPSSSEEGSGSPGSDDDLKSGDAGADDTNTSGKDDPATPNDEAGDAASDDPSQGDDAESSDEGDTEDSEASETGSDSGQDDGETSDESGDDDETADDGGETGDPDAVVLVDRNCVDGQYIVDEAEQFLEPNEFPPIDDLIGNFSSDDYMSFIYGVLERRYPTGKRIIEEAGGKPAVDAWLIWGADSAQGVLNSLGMVVHEVGHGLNQQHPENVYYVAAQAAGGDLVVTVPGMHGPSSTSSSPMYSMERSRLLADDLNALRPPAPSSKITTSKEFGEGPWGQDDGYAEIYLSGNPDDTSFESGDQGFNMLVEELLQYSNSLAIAYYLQDHRRSAAARRQASSDRHAMLSLLWWMQRYLRIIRVEHVEQYQYLLENETWLEFLLTAWGKAWMYLRTDLPGMQPDSDELHHLVQQRIVREEIQRLRVAFGCDASLELLPDFVEPE